MSLSSGVRLGPYEVLASLNHQNIGGIYGLEDAAPSARRELLTGYRFRRLRQDPDDFTREGLGKTAASGLQGSPFRFRVDEDFCRYRERR